MLGHNDGARSHQVARVLLDKALCGDMQTIREVLDCVEGEAPEAQEHTGEIEHKVYMGAVEELRSRIARIRAARGTESGTQESE